MAARGLRMRCGAIAAAGALAGLLFGACDQQTGAPATGTPKGTPTAKGEPTPPAKADAAATAPVPTTAEQDGVHTLKDPSTTPANPTLPIEKVTISGKEFKLEAALTMEQRFHGLSGRTSIPPDGGMLFVMPTAEVKRLKFVMRDCPVAIDIIYLDVAGRIVGMHKMVPETQRSDAEKVVKRPAGTPPRSTGYTDWPLWTWTNEAYEGRLKPYPSSGPAQFAIELAGNTLDSLRLKDGQKIDLDLDRLKKATK